MAPMLVTLQPGQTATAFVVWRNFCGPQSATPLTFRVTLPGAQAALTTAVTGPPGGTPLAITPRCDSPSSPSTLSVGPFEQIGRVASSTPTVLPKTGGMPLPLTPAALATAALGMGLLLRRLASR
jgi:hypothetical protein